MSQPAAENAPQEQDLDLEIMACPVCVTAPAPALPGKFKGQLEPASRGEDGMLTSVRCPQCGRIYKKQDGIFNFLPEAATQG